MTEQDKADLIKICEVKFWGEDPSSPEAEAAYQRVRDRFDINKVYKSYSDAAFRAAVFVLSGDKNKP